MRERERERKITREKREEKRERETERENERARERVRERVRERESEREREREREKEREKEKEKEKEKEGEKERDRKKETALLVTLSNTRSHHSQGLALTLVYARESARYRQLILTMHSHELILTNSFSLDITNSILSYQVHELCSELLSIRTPF